MIRADLNAACFADCTIETVKLTGHAPSSLSPAIGMCQGSPMRAEIEALDPSGLMAATEAAATELAGRFGDGSFAAGMQALVIETRK